jgi:hypothetical protein
MGCGYAAILLYRGTEGCESDVHVCWEKGKEMIDTTCAEGREGTMRVSGERGGLWRCCANV